MGKLLVDGGNWSPLAACRKGSLMEQVTFTQVRLPSLVGIPVSLACLVISIASQASDCLLKLSGRSRGKGDGLRLQVHI